MKHQDLSASVREFSGHKPNLGLRVFVDRSAVVLGDVVLGDDCSIWPQVAIRGDMNRIRIGARTSIQDNTVCHITHAGPFNPEGWPLLIGDDCTIAHGVIVHGCTIGNRVLIGMGSIVMDGAVIEDEVVVGANSLVTPGKRLESGYLYTGSPAKKVRPLSDKEKEYFVYSAKNYCQLKDHYLAEEQESAE